MQTSVKEYAVWMLLFFALFGSGIPASGCDTSVLQLFQGTDPQALLAREMLAECNQLQAFAADIAAFNSEAARERLVDILQKWLSLSGSLVQAPPKGEGEEGWREKLNDISRFLGDIRKSFDQEQFQEAHDQVEPVVIQLSILGSIMLAQERLRSFLEVEYRLSLLKPGFRGKERSQLLTELDGFSADFAVLSKRFPREHQPNVDALVDRASRFKSLLESEKDFRSPILLAGYSQLLQDFERLRKKLFESGVFTPELPDKGPVQKTLR